LPGWSSTRVIVLVLVVVLVLEGVFLAGACTSRDLEGSRFLPPTNHPLSRRFFFTQPQSALMFFAVKLEVVVMPKRSVLDPQGVAVRNAVRELGLTDVGTVRVGKIIELEFTGEPDEAKLDEICRDLLCNQVIEDYRILAAVPK
jgi:phosphoribosylformylglycinamidine synthase PurS subunit